MTDTRNTLSGPENTSGYGTVSATNYETDKEQLLRCSRKNCYEQAPWQILWNNPKIHSPDRRKIWLSCDEHRNWLENYLKIRHLWRETLPISSSSLHSPSQKQ